MNPNPPTSRSPDWLLFLGKFLRHGTAIASFAPSSRWLARAMVRGIDFDRARCVVELGAGTGPVTAELVRHARPDCKLVIVERDPDFCRRLRQRFPQAEVVEADALDFAKLLDERGIGEVDHVLSGLPLPSFPKEDRDRLIQLVGHRLTSSGTFHQITAMPWVYRGLYRSYFEEVKFRLVAMNLPPGGVYVCRGPRNV